MGAQGPLPTPPKPSEWAETRKLVPLTACSSSLRPLLSSLPRFIQKRKEGDFTIVLGHNRVSSTW